jgi:hypothetical protein
LVLRSVFKKVVGVFVHFRAPLQLLLVANRVAGAVGDSISNCTLPSNLFVLEVRPKLQLQKLDYKRLRFPCTPSKIVFLFISN